jgi:hypothetical protein
MVVHVCNLSPWLSETGGWRIGGQPRLHMETLSQKIKVSFLLTRAILLVFAISSPFSSLPLSFFLFLSPSIHILPPDFKRGQAPFIKTDNHLLMFGIFLAKALVLPFFIYKIIKIALQKL